MQTLNFFGESGLTSTSANHVANMAKEYVRNQHEILNAIRFIDTSVGLLTSEKMRTVSQGFNKVTLDKIPGIVDNIAKANSLIAWLREAIKEKEKRSVEAEEWEATTSREGQREAYQIHNAKRPVRRPYPTAEIIKQGWTVGDQERYLSLEAEAAAIGELIHEKGAMNVARLMLMKKISNPVAMDLNGSETIVTEYHPSVALSDVNDVFSALQAKHREVQAQLNGMKKIIEDEIQTRKMEIDAEYAAARREWDKEEKMLMDEGHRIEEYEEQKRLELIQEVQALKIVIPNRLKSVYEEIMSK